jgi:quinol monooxygenase YgiN
MSSPRNLAIREYPGLLTPFLEQLNTETDYVTFINTFILPSAEASTEFLKHWKGDGNYMKSQYGMLSAQLHRSIGEKSNVFVNVAVWESTAAFRRAFQNPEFQQSLSGFPEGTLMFPVILSKVAVPGVCGA